MRKTIIRIITAMLCLIIPFSSVACGQVEEKDPNKSYLYVGVWDGGYRDNWAKRWAEEFEALHVNTEFEPGKKGVDVEVAMSKNYIDDACAQKLNDYDDHIIFTEMANYYEFIRSGTAVDITEWVTTPLTEYGEERSIADKLSAGDREYYSVTESNPTYYGLPWYCSFLTMSYDIELFEDENLYFAAEGEGDASGFVTSTETPKSLGPDGRTGLIEGVDYSVDDGMPATYDDFFVLCDKIVDLGYIPFIWAGGFQIYVTELVNSLVADYEGYDNMSMKYTLDGTATDLVAKIENGIAILESTPTKIDTTNGYLLKKQAGEYYALKFLHRLITTRGEDGFPKYYDETDCFGGAMSHTGAQAKFLQSNHSNSITTIAMIIDGTWWYNEATTVFDSMSGRPGLGQKERRIGIMPMPKATPDKVGEDATWMNTYTTSVVVNSTIPEELMDLAREFFRFIHTDKALSSYVADANGIRPFDYELTGVADKDISLFGRSQYDVYKNAKVVNPYDTNYVMQNYLNSIHLNFDTIVDRADTLAVENDSYSRVTDAFSEGVTAEEYFWGYGRYMTETRWSRFIPGVQ